MDKLSVVIPFYNGHDTIQRLLSTIPEEIFSVVIIDDCSDTPLNAEYFLREYSAEVYRLDKKGYFTGAVNRGIQETQTDVLVLNQDTWFENRNWLSLLESHRRHFGMIGERIRGTHPAFGDLGYIHGTFMFLRRDAIEAVGLLNQADYPLWGSTAEYQWRVARKNFSVLPLKEIPGFRHERPTTERFGSSIKDLLEKEPERKSLLVRTPPLLSVVMPCYNYGHYVADAVNSLIGGPTSLGQMPGQTLQSFEIVIVDDASTDASPEYIKEIADLSKGIRAYRLNQNVGTARALNYGINKAVGQYITFLSADDMREPESLENLVRVCEQNPHSFAYDDVWLFNRHQKIKKWPMEEYDFDKLIWKNQIHAGIVYPKSAWEEVGGYPPEMHNGREDWAFNVALGVHGWCGKHVKQYGYLYRREGQNRTERNTTERHRQEFLAKIMSVFPSIYEGERPVACCGKGSNKKSNNGTVSSSVYSLGGSAKMANQIGAEGMVKLEYLGRQMSSTWTGDATGASYTFGMDRPRGWVDKRDVGSREDRRGFLSIKDRNGAFMFRVASAESKMSKAETVESVELSTVKQAVENVAPENRGAVGKGDAVATLSADTEVKEQAVKSQDQIDPTHLNVEEIRMLDEGRKIPLTKKEWEDIYRLELENRNRKSAVAFLEEKLASFD